jgi:hypothetical protein
LNCNTKFPSGAEVFDKCSLNAAEVEAGIGPIIEKLANCFGKLIGTSVADNQAESRRTAAVRRRLETKNDESRFGLTRAPLPAAR